MSGTFWCRKNVLAPGGKIGKGNEKAVAYLLPFIEQEKLDNPDQDQNSSAGRVLMATVKGDVHDIGKNIVGVVLACNNFEIVDMGVMVPAQEIIKKPKK